MTIAHNFAASLSQAELQDLVKDMETGLGPLETIQQGQEAGVATTLIGFDDAVIVDAPVTTLRVAGQTGPTGGIPYTRGPCLLQGTAQVLIGFVPAGEIFLVRRVVSVMTGLGWSADHAIGIAANIKGESNFDPREDTGDGGKAYGLCQWHADRQARFQGHFNTGIKGSTFREQLLFIDRELRTGNQEKVAGDLLMQAASAEDAAEVVCRKYERPGNPDGDAAKRRAFATTFKQTLKV